MDVEREISRDEVVEAAGARRIEEAWMESERSYDEKRRRENLAAWHGWHLDQAERHRRTLEELIRHHETQAARLCEEGAA